MNQEYAQFAGPLLGLAGGAWQFVRAHRAVSDWWTAIYAVGLALSVYALCFDYAAHAPIQKTLIMSILWIGEHAVTVVGGTFIASSAAKAGLSAVPMTNSK